MIAISKMNEISSKNEMNTVHYNKNSDAGSNRSMNTVRSINQSIHSRNTADRVE